jgi:hypothetical protein
VSGSFKGVDPPLEGSGGKGDDYPGLFTLNYAKILGFEPAHDTDHEYEGEAGAWGTNPLHRLSGPHAVLEFQGSDLADCGRWGGPKSTQLLKGAQFQPDLIPINHQNSHELSLIHKVCVVGWDYDNSRTLINWNCYFHIDRFRGWSRHRLFK